VWLKLYIHVTGDKNISRSLALKVKGAVRWVSTLRKYHTKGFNTDVRKGGKKFSLCTF